jgi:hypothetical protein
VRFRARYFPVPMAALPASVLPCNIAALVFVRGVAVGLGRTFFPVQRGALGPFLCTTRKAPLGRCLIGMRLCRFVLFRTTPPNTPKCLTTSSFALCTPARAADTPLPPVSAPPQRRRVWWCGCAVVRHTQRSSRNTTMPPCAGMSFTMCTWTRQTTPPAAERRILRALRANACA